MLQLLGVPQFNGTPVVLERALYLVTLLVCHETPMSREELMLLLWEDDGDDSVMKKRLRQLGYRTQKFPYGAALEAGTNTFTYTSISDVMLFRQAIQARQWETALALYKGSLLEGAVFEHSELEEWFRLERDTLRAAFVKAALAHAASLEKPEAARLLEVAMRHDPHNEDLLQKLLEYAKAAPEIGERAFAKFEKSLAQDLGLEPSSELKKQVQHLASTAVIVPAATRSTFPTPRSAFVGRHAELEQIAGLLENARLLTLLGVGGVGKTRLALEVAQRHPSAYFVDLARLQNPELVPHAMLEALGQRAEKDVLERLHQILSSRQMFLVLDNFEHVMSARDLVVQLLDQHPKLQLLVTSRERLGLAQEQIFEVGALPAPDTLFPLESQDAARIFLQAARRNKMEFSLQNNFKQFNRIYNAVAGMPLGLELSASWVRTLSLQEIADELGNSLDVLSVDSPDMPERHRSFAAVFSSSWQLLSAEEQRVLSQLSIFRGGFDKDMAKKVGNASLPILLKLVNKSLVTRHQQRFVMHELVRQYSESQNPDPQGTLERLGDTMLELSAAFMQHKNGEQQIEYLKRLDLEHDNFRSVLHWSLKHAPELGAKIVGHLEQFWYLRGYRQEGFGWAKQFLQQHQTDDQTMLDLLWAYTSLAKELSLYEEAKAGLERYTALAQSLNHAPALANSEKFVGLLAREKNDLEQSQIHFERAITMYQQLEDFSGLGFCMNELGILFVNKKDYASAKNHFEQSLHYKRLMSDKQGIAYAMGNLGIAFGQMGDLEMKRVLQEESLAIKRELGDQKGIAIGLYQLGHVLYRQNRLEESLPYFAESIQILERIGQQYSVITTINQLSIIAWELRASRIALEFSVASIHWRYMIRNPPEQHWLEKQKEWQEESGLSPAELAKLEFEVQKRSLEEVVQGVVGWAGSYTAQPKARVLI